jgi:serine protease Do
LRVVRDGREQTVVVKLAERPVRDARAAVAPPQRLAEPLRKHDEGALGLTVRELDATAFNRYDLPRETRGLLITRVEPLSSSSDAEIQRGTVLLEMNRKPVSTVAEYQRLVRAMRPGDVLTLYIYSPDLDQRQLKTVRVDAP